MALVLMAWADPLADRLTELGGVAETLESMQKLANLGPSCSL